MAFKAGKKATALVCALAMPVILSGCDAALVDFQNHPVVGGGDTSIEDVPYQVALLQGSSQFCGGSILSENWVLTANHCVQVDQEGSISVLAGVSKVSEADAGQQITVKEIHKLPGFSGDTRKGGDIALLRLAAPLVLDGDTTATIELATPAHRELGLTAPGTMGLVSGWGVTDPNAFGSPDQLQSVEVPVIAFRTAQDLYKARLTRDQIAAAFLVEGGKDACFGDSGGPYVVPNAAGDGSLLTGVVSWGESCALASAPGMYARVSSHIDFITQTMALPPRVIGPILLVNEILADPEHDANGDGTIHSSTDEFVELINVGDRPLDLSGGTLSDDSRVRVTFPSGTVIESGGVLVVFGGGAPAVIPGAAVVTGSLSLNNKGDTITVATGDGETQASVRYGSMADSGQSIVLAREGDATAHYVIHTKKGTALASPGTRSDNSSF